MQQPLHLHHMLGLPALTEEEVRLQRAQQNLLWLWREAAASTDLAPETAERAARDLVAAKRAAAERAAQRAAAERKAKAEAEARAQA